AGELVAQRIDHAGRGTLGQRDAAGIGLDVVLLDGGRDLVEGGVVDVRFRRGGEEQRLRPMGREGTKLKLGEATAVEGAGSLDPDAVTDGPAREVPVEGGKAPGVDDDHVAPVTAEPTAPAAAHREVVHDSSVGSVHRGPVVGCDVETAMEVLAGAAGIVGLEW